MRPAKNKKESGKSKPTAKIQFVARTEVKTSKAQGPAANLAKDTNETLDMLRNFNLDVEAYDKFIQDLVRNKADKKIISKAKEERQLNLEGRLGIILDDSDNFFVAEAVRHNANGFIYFDMEHPSLKQKNSSQSTAEEPDLVEQVSNEIAKLKKDGDGFAITSGGHTISAVKRDGGFYTYDSLTGDLHQTDHFQELVEHLVAKFNTNRAKEAEFYQLSCSLMEPTFTPEISSKPSRVEVKLPEKYLTLKEYLEILVVTLKDLNFNKEIQETLQPYCECAGDADFLPDVQVQKAIVEICEDIKRNCAKDGAFYQDAFDSAEQIKNYINKFLLNLDTNQEEFKQPTRPEPQRQLASIPPTRADSKNDVTMYMEEGDEPPTRTEPQRKLVSVIPTHGLPTQDDETLIREYIGVLEYISGRVNEEQWNVDGQPKYINNLRKIFNDELHGKNLTELRNIFSNVERQINSIEPNKKGQSKAATDLCNELKEIANGQTVDSKKVFLDKANRELIRENAIKTVKNNYIQVLKYIHRKVNQECWNVEGKGIFSKRKTPKHIVELRKILKNGDFTDKNLTELRSIFLDVEKQIDSINPKKKGRSEKVIKFYADLKKIVNGKIENEFLDGKIKMADFRNVFLDKGNRHNLPKPEKKIRMHYSFH